MSPADWSWRWYPRSRPRRKEGGIVARSRRGGFGSSWWSRQFVQRLADLGFASRLARGRSYARSGQVFDLEVEPGTARARVQGSRYRPYEVTIAARPIPERIWRKVARDLADRTRHAAVLLAGRLPEEIEAVFEAHGSSLLPQGRRSLTMRCSCPDPVNPCKHVAAVYYILAERFDDDPFTLLAWRGIARETLLEAVGSRLRETGRTPPAPPDGVRGFWELPEGVAPRDPCDTAPSRSANAAVLEQLGAIDVCVGGRPLHERLAALHRAIVEALDEDEVPRDQNPSGNEPVARDSAGADRRGARFEDAGGVRKYVEDGCGSRDAASR
ncbi:MAG: hypothetical protein D6776_02960 [Planctomycetota bacterium]|nr:MAG: hypothetical protein D6776_02960 [Planctomycetota bacterium]